MQENSKAIIIDNGAAIIKAGIGNIDTPQCSISNVVGRSEPGSEKCTIGEKAIRRRKKLALTSPMKNWDIKDWDDMERVWKHIIRKELRAERGEHPLLLTEPPLSLIHI